MKWDNICRWLVLALIVCGAGLGAEAATITLEWNTTPNLVNRPTPHVNVAVNLWSSTPSQYTIDKVEVELYCDEEMTQPYLVPFIGSTGAYATVETINQANIAWRNVIKLNGRGLGKWQADIPTEALALSNEYFMYENIYINAVIYHNGSKKSQDKTSVREKLARGEKPAYVFFAPNIVTPSVKLTPVESYWNPEVNQEALFQKEKREHGVCSYGNGGYFVRIDYERHPQKTMPIVVRLELMREDDVLHPKYPVDGSPIAQIDQQGWPMMMPIEFKVMKDERGMEAIDYSVRPGVTEPISSVLEFHRTNWEPFEIFVPWQTLHLYDLHPEVKDLKVNVFFHAEVWKDQERTIEDIVRGHGMLGQNETIPNHRYVRQNTSPENTFERLSEEDFSDEEEEEEECIDIVDLSLKLIETATYPAADPILKRYQFSKCSSDGYHRERPFREMYNRGVEMQVGRAMAPQARWATVSYSDRAFDDHTFIHVNMVDRPDDFAPKTKAIECWMTEDATKHVCDLKQALAAHGFTLLKKGIGTSFFASDKYVMYVMEFVGMSLTVLERKEKDCFDLLAMAADMLSGNPGEYLDKIFKKYNFDRCTHLPENPVVHGHYGERHEEGPKANFGDVGYLFCFEDNTKIRIHGYDVNDNPIHDEGWGYAKPAYFVFRINKGFNGFKHLCNFPGAGYRKVKEFTNIDKSRIPEKPYHVVEYTNDVLTFQTVNDGRENYNVIVTRAGKEVKPATLEEPTPQEPTPGEPTPGVKPPSTPDDKPRVIFIPGGKKPHHEDEAVQEEEQPSNAEEQPGGDEAQTEESSAGMGGEQEAEPAVIADPKRETAVEVMAQVEDLFDAPTLQQALEKAKEKGFDEIGSQSDVFFSATRHEEGLPAVTIGCAGTPGSPVDNITITFDNQSETAIIGKLKEMGFDTDHLTTEERTMDANAYVVITCERASDGEKVLIVKKKGEGTGEMSVSLTRGANRHTGSTGLPKPHHTAAADTIFFCDFNDMTTQGWIANGPNCDGYATAEGTGLDSTPSLQLRTKADANDYEAMAARAIGTTLPEQSSYVIRFHARAKQKGGKLRLAFTPYLEQEFEVGTAWTECEGTFKIKKNDKKQDTVVFLFFGTSQNTYDIDDFLLLKR